MIYSIGDSHNDIFMLLGESQVNITDTKILAYNIAFKKLLDDMLPKIDKEKDKIILGFGEIDCRFHIYPNHVKTGHNIDDIIDDIMVRYEKVFDKLEGFDFAVYLLRPPGSWDDNYIPNPERGHAWNCPKNVRPYIYAQFHDKSKVMCLSKGVKIIDVWEEVVDSEGYIKQEYRRNEVWDIHLKLNAFSLVLRELKKQFPDLVLDETKFIKW